MLHYLPIVPKASIYAPKVMRKPVIGGNTVCLRLSRTCFFSEVCEVSKSGPEEQSIWSVMAEYGREGCIEISRPIVPKASIHVPKVMRKPVIGGNTVSETFTHMFLF